MGAVAEVARMGAIDDEPLPLYGDGLQIRDWLFVLDHCDAIAHILEVGEPGGIYNVGGGQEASLSRVVSILEDLAGTTLNVDRQPAQRGDVIRTGADTSRARRSRGWEPSTELENGLAAELAWVVDRRGPGRACLVGGEDHVPPRRQHRLRQEA